MKKFLLAAVLIAISACTIRPEPYKINIPGLSIEPDNGKSSSNGKFCPPGQAKKGNC